MPLTIQPPALARSLPFAVFIGALALRGALEGQVDGRWWYAAQAGAAALVLAVLWNRYDELRTDRARAAQPVGLGASVLVGLVVFVLWIVLNEPWMRLGEPVASFVPLHEDGSLHWAQIIVRTMGAVIVVPLVEELFWRSFLMRWIDRREFLNWPPAQVSLYALLVSSALFALAHSQWLAGLLAGLAFGELYRRTGQIWHAIVAHAVANLALAVWVVSQRDWGFW